MLSFKLPSAFTNQYATKDPGFGFNGLGEVVYMRTYSRLKPDGTQERWHETCERVINGMYTALKDHCLKNNRPWSEDKAQRSAQEAYDRLFYLKWSPSGRGLWMMGSEFVHQRGIPEGLQNCAFRTTAHIATEKGSMFEWFMEMLMLGVGVGSDMRGKGTVLVYDKQPGHNDTVYVIPDSREGWSHSVGLLVSSYISELHPYVHFDYSLIRPKGEPIKGFGGIASGPLPLQKLHDDIRSFMRKNAGSPIASRTIADILNSIGRCVIAGNIRRSATILLGQDGDTEFSNLKNYELNPERAEIGWASNNSVFAHVGMDYTEYAERIKDNGEPGFVWLENIQNFGMMNGVIDKNDNATGVNPCQPAWATVLTRDGIRTLGEVGVGSEIWSSEGWTKIVNKWSTGVKPVYKYQYTGGQFIGTENHRVVTPNGKQEVGNAEKVMVIAGETPEIIIHDPKIVMDGLFFGDGYYKQERYPLLIIGQNDRSYFNSEVAHLIHQRMDKTETSTQHVIETSIATEEKPRTYDLSIPERFLRGSTNEKASFLRGLYSANGSVVGNSGPRVTLKTASATLRDQVMLMLSSLGIRSYYTTNSPKAVEFCNGTYECRESYDINITRDTEKFVSTIGFIQPYKTEKAMLVTGGRRLNGTQYSTRKEVEYLGDHEVFDITVDNGSHTYWTGGLNVSNCGEMGLNGDYGELCNLVELYPTRNTDMYDFARSIKFAYLYGKAVTLLNENIRDPKTREIMMRNRRIGLSMTGIAQFVAQHGTANLREWAIYGAQEVDRYDRVYSHWLNVPFSLRKRTIKPSGSVSLLAGVTPGVHHPEDRYYIRRIRIATGTELEAAIINAGYHTEPDTYSSDTTVVEFPVFAGDGVRSVKEVSMWEQLELAAFMQQYWSDNSVSVTVTFDPETPAPEIAAALELYQHRLKAVSMLPRTEEGAYAQMPYEAITQDKYESMIANITGKISVDKIEDRTEDKYCDTDVCAIDFNKPTE